MACIFCQPLPYILENDLAAAFFDKKPVSPGAFVDYSESTLCHVF